MEGILRQGLAWAQARETCIPPLLTFGRLLLEKNQVMNLTAITDPDQVAALHFLDSLAVWQAGELEGASLIDVGTGAGFPGLPLRIAHPDLRVTLLDSLGKRVTFLEEVCAALGLSDVACVHGRAEEFASARRERFDAAVSRAVADLRILSELCLPLVRVGGRFIAMKSTDCEGELTAAGGAVRTLGGRVERLLDYDIPGAGVRHRLVIIRKERPTPAKYPRRFAQIKKQPL